MVAVSLTLTTATITALSSRSWRRSRRLLNAFRAMPVVAMCFTLAGVTATTAAIITAITA